MLAAIPYHTFPDLSLGPLDLRVFGMAVAVAVLMAAWFAGVHAERRVGMPREDTYRLATWMVIAGLVGSRITWDITNWDEIESPLDLIAVWEGGLQFSGGFICAVAVGMPTFLRWERLQRWRLLDIFGTAVALGVSIGRIGCTAVGEHFGRQSDFFLAVRFEGGEVRENSLGLGANAEPVAVNTTFHNTALYELVLAGLLFGALWWLLRRKPDLVPGSVVGVFFIAYSIIRFGLDALRVNDERVAGLTGAQYMCLAMIPIGIWVLTKVRSRNAELVAAEVGAVASEVADAPADGDAAKPPGGSSAEDESRIGEAGSEERPRRGP